MEGIDVNSVPGMPGIPGIPGAKNNIVVISPVRYICITQYINNRTYTNKQYPVAFFVNENSKLAFAGTVSGLAD